MSERAEAAPGISWAEDLQIQARAANLRDEWDRHPPKDVIDGLLAGTPETLPQYTALELESISREPSKLMLYFLSNMPDLPDLKSRSLLPGTFSARNSIEFCLGDEVRTKLLMEEISASVTHLEATTPGTRWIEVCEAGAGALAPLSIYAALCSERIRCTALELNPESAELARKSVAAFGLQDRIQVIEADARQFKPETQLDLLVSETMNTGLTDEPIVQIMSNLQPHVRDTGIIIPSGIQVSAAVVSRNAYSRRDRFVLLAGRTFPVIPPGTNWTGWRQVVDYRPATEPKLPLIDFVLTVPDYPAGEYHLLVSSEVDIGPTRKLRQHQSLVTMYREALADPNSMALIKLGPNYPTAIRVQYKPGQDLVGKAKYHQ